MRNVLIVLGLWMTFSLLTIAGAAIANHLPRYVGAHERIGSMVLLHLTVSTPAIVAAAICGAIAGFVFVLQRRLWSMLTLFGIVATFASWNRGATDAENIIGTTVSIVVLAGCFIGAGMLARRVR